MYSLSDPATRMYSLLVHNKRAEESVAKIIADFQCQHPTDRVYFHLNQAVSHSPALALGKSTSTPLYKDPNASVEMRVTDLLGRMTIEDKMGQLIQGTSPGLLNRVWDSGI